MSKHILSDQLSAADNVARTFAASQNFTTSLEVREDKCFHSGSGWLDLGTVTLKPSADIRGSDSLGALRDAVRFGFYEWRVSSGEELQRSILRLFRIEEEGNQERNEAPKKRLFKALVGLTHAVQRVGLQHPIFDAGSLAAMPFRRPTTIVSDTNSILQGSLDFVVRFLSPAARVKIPAVAQMEILVWVGNYFGLRYDPKRLQRAYPNALYEHMRSQGAQRALLRLELLTDAELERARIGADPLRGIVYPDPDQEDKNLGLQAVQRSFADRLILETALQHLQLATPGHVVMLMTSDQGLARMALAEGVQVLYYEAAELNPIAGETIPGTLFHPFDGSLYSVPLTELVWELAVTFGACRLRAANGDGCFEVNALGEQFSWKPYHAKEDLLWICSSLQALGAADEQESVEQAPPPNPPAPPGRDEDTSAGAAPGRTLMPSYKFSPKVMLRLIQILTNGKAFTNAELMSLLGFKHERKLAEYRSFLLSGGFIVYTAGTVTGNDKLGALWTALRSKNYEQLAPLLLDVESVRALFEAIRERNPLPHQGQLPIKFDALSNYRCLLELSALVLQIVNEGLYATPNRPKPSEFADIAYRAYLQLARREGEYVATGAWLEELAKSHGIHPLVARDRLEEARAANLLDRYVEGSTPDTRYAGRTFCMLDFINNQLTIRDISLYEGDFLIPAKGSVTLRLKRTP